MATPEFKQKLHKLLASFENKASNNYAPELTGYVPTKSSGVTIATGFDLGKHNANDIKALKLPKSIEAKLLPYALKHDKKTAKTLTITADEAKAIDNAVMDSKYSKFANEFQKVHGKPISTLDENTRIALTSAFFNMGPAMLDKKANKSMYAALQSGDNKIIHAEIADFHDGGSKQPLSRRLAEAAVAGGFINATDSYGISNFKDLMAKNPEARTAYRTQWANMSPNLVPANDPSNPEGLPSYFERRMQFAQTDPRRIDLASKEPSMLQRAVEGMIPSAQAAETDGVRTAFAQTDPRRVDLAQPTYDYIPQQPVPYTPSAPMSDFEQPQYATMEDLLADRGLMGTRGL